MLFTSLTIAPIYKHVLVDIPLVEAVENDMLTRPQRTLLACNVNAVKP